MTTHQVRINTVLWDQLTAIAPHLGGSPRDLMETAVRDYLLRQAEVHTTIKGTLEALHQTSHQDI